MNTWNEMSFVERLEFLREFYLNITSGSSDEELAETDYARLPADLQQMLQGYDE